MSVVSVDNKTMLLELMKSIGSDNQLIINDRALEAFVTEKCVFFHANRFEFGDLNEVNKKIVELGYNYIMSNQPRVNQPRVKERGGGSVGGSVNGGSVGGSVKGSVEGSVDRRAGDSFETGLASQESQFKKMMNPAKPKEIDFSDGGDEFPIDNMVGVMNQTLADRTKELASITEKYSSSDKEKAKKWLNREETPKKLKIENVLDIPIHEGKKVRFAEPVNNLFSKLKQKTGLMDKLDLIISNQEKIMKMFS